MNVGSSGRLVANSDDKRHVFRVIEAEFPGWDDDRIADLLGVGVRTLQRWRAERRKLASQVRSDARHCRLKLAGRA